MIFSITVTKTIECQIEADSAEEARELAEDYESNGWDSMWWSARPDIEVHRWDVSDESRSYGV